MCIIGIFLTNFGGLGRPKIDSIFLPIFELANCRYLSLIQFSLFYAVIALFSKIYFNKDYPKIIDPNANLNFEITNEFVI